MSTATESKTATCAKCAHWNATEGDTKGECRRHAPQAISFQVADGVSFETRFPTTRGQDWCGEFTAK